MNDIRLPKPNQPVVGPGGLATREWLDFWRGLAGVTNVAELREILAQAQEAIANLEQAGGLSSDTKVIGDGSVDVEGVLSGGVVSLSLVNDSVSPDPASYYGTSKAGGKGWHGLAVDALGDVDAPAPSDGDALIWSSSAGKWIPAPVSFDFGSPLTDDLGNILTDQDGNVLTDGRLSIDWADVDNKPNTDGIPEGTTNLYYTSTRAQSVADFRIADHVEQPDPHPQYQLESGLGSAAFEPTTSFATATQGTKADSAIQPGQNVSLLANNAGYLTSVPAASTQPWTPYTVATLPSVTPAYRSIYVTDLTGNPGPCYSDGTNWRRYSDDSIAS